MTDFEPLAEELRQRAQAGDGPVALGRALVELAKGEFRPMMFIAVFRMAFGVPLQALQESVSWTGFGEQDVEDSEFVARLGPYIEAWRQSQST